VEGRDAPGTVTKRLLTMNYSGDIVFRLVGGGGKKLLTSAVESLIIASFLSHTPLENYED